MSKSMKNTNKVDKLAVTLTVVFAIVFIVIGAAVLTPPDVVSQVLLALPMWALFEISILFMRRD